MFFQSNTTPVQGFTPINPFQVFYMLTGLTFFGFVTGFSSCLFDLNQVKECVDYAEKATAALKAAGDHILAWFTAVVQEILNRYPIDLSSGGGGGHYVSHVASAPVNLPGSNGSTGMSGSAYLQNFQGSGRLPAVNSGAAVAVHPRQ